MEDALKLILEASIYRFQREKAGEPKSVDAFVSHTKAKALAKEKMIAAIEKL